MSHLGSLFPVDKHVVIAAANAALVIVEKFRARCLEQAIDKEMKCWFRRPKSREEAKERLLDPDNWKDSFKPKYINGGWGVEYNAKGLLEVCSVTSAYTVYLSTEDARFVNRYKEKDDAGMVDK